jgi:preprotein translocase subunit YajC
MVSEVQAQTKAPANSSKPQGGPSFQGFLFMMILMFGIIYLFMIRPQQKKQRKMQTMLDALKKGDRVLTSGGIMGEVQGLKEGTVILKIAENVKVEFKKGAIASIITDKKSTEKKG